MTGLAPPHERKFRDVIDSYTYMLFMYAIVCKLQ